MERLEDLRLPEGLEAALKTAGWALDSLSSRERPRWTQWKGTATRRDSIARIRLWDFDAKAPDVRTQVLQAIDGPHWARHEAGGRVLAVSALDPEQACEHRDDLIEVIAAGATNKRGLKRWLDSLGLSAVEITTTDEAGVRELSGVGTLGPLRMAATTRRPSARTAPPASWTRTVQSGSALATAGEWAVSTSVFSHGAATAIIASVVGDAASLG